MCDDYFDTAFIEDKKYSLTHGPTFSSSKRLKHIIIGKHLKKFQGGRIQGCLCLANANIYQTKMQYGNTHALLSKSLVLPEQHKFSQLLVPKSHLSTRTAIWEISPRVGICLLLNWTIFGLA